MKITVWHKSGAGTVMEADDYSRIFVDEKSVWNAVDYNMAENEDTLDLVRIGDRVLRKNPDRIVRVFGIKIFSITRS